MGTTPVNKLPYPEPTAQPFVHLDIQALAEAADAKLYVECTSSTRPAHKAGRRIFETDTGLSYISDGTTWVRIAEGLDADVHHFAGTSQTGQVSSEMTTYTTTSYTAPASGRVLIAAQVDAITSGNAAGEVGIIVDGTTLRSKNWHSRSKNTALPVVVFSMLNVVKGRTYTIGLAGRLSAGSTTTDYSYPTINILD